MGKIAFVFSGQGAQYTGMGKELYECSPAAKAVYDMADSIREGTSAQCFEAEQEVLNRTVNTSLAYLQPTLQQLPLLQKRALSQTL